MTNRRPSLRFRLLIDLAYLMAAAVAIVGLTTLVLLGGDLRQMIWPLGALWIGSIAVFVVFGAYLVRRLVIRPIERLTSEADQLAAGEFPDTLGAYESPELSHLAERYHRMAADLLDAQSQVVRVEKLAGIGRLAAGVAHEVRNPLGALSTYTEVLRRRGVEPSVTDEMRDAIERIELIVQSLLDYARPGTPTGRTDLAEATRATLNFLEAQGLFREHMLTVELADQVPCVTGDRHKLEQVVLNLVTNACDAAPAARVWVGVRSLPFESRHAAKRRANDEVNPLSRGGSFAPRPRRPEIAEGTPGVLLYVADDGPGVPDADRERIFDPFYTTKDPGKGTGLGLAIVARTVHELGGTVWVDRAREGGAAFKIFLPVAGSVESNAHPHR
ncbi:MAG: HAMP domain-containing histidine kinase [Gemmatimonadales bacterium]|nr:HAMP domain-containing histidine kinase [Gemmatimonadales bacterium]